MAILLCPQCRHEQPAPDKDLGKISRCPKCEARAEVLSRNPDQVSPADISLPLQADASLVANALNTGAPEPAFGLRSSAPSSNAETKALILIGFVITALLTISIGMDLLSRTDLPPEIEVAPPKVSVEYHPSKWEYRIESPSDSSFTRQMNLWGSDGWELVTARRATGSYDSVSYEVILKRPVKSNPYGNSYSLDSQP